MPDGVRLAARLWRPVTDQPVPAILEYIPYRKTDMVRARDERNHPYWASHGYACIRVDMRGSGDSEGHMPDMYAPAELTDAREVIGWLADQDWCDGNIGMLGTSWGGTASLQVSVRAPDALKAVIAVCATHDRFEDDIHYMGGCVLSDTFEWGATLPAILGAPPTPNVGADWMEHWRDRIAAMTCPVENWLRENSRGAYWRHGSVIHEAEALSVPILSVGGWSDRYSNSVMALVDARPDLVWGVIGPWGHHYPDHGAPGPAIGFQRMALDWWDHWLKPQQPGPLNWPKLRVWLREFDAPKETVSVSKGQWIESGPTTTETEVRRLELRLEFEANEDGPWPVPSDPGIGTTSGETGYFGRSGGLPIDQSKDDSQSLVFETAPFDRDMVLYGAATLEMTGRTGSGGGAICARLNDVSPAGVAVRVTYGLRNIALNKDLDLPDEPVEPGVFDADLRFHSTAYVVRKGHRLRLAFAQAMWPLVVGDGLFQEIDLEKGHITLPVLAKAPVPLSDPFPAAIALPRERAHRPIENSPLQRWLSEDSTTKEMGWHQPPMAMRYDQIDTTFAYETRITHALEGGAQPIQTTHIAHEMQFIRPDGTAVIATSLESRRSGQEWTVSVTFSAKWDEEEIATRQWLIQPSVGGARSRV